MDDSAVFPKRVRLSTGSAAVLRLLNAKLDAPPTTTYLMTYRRGKCNANCGFCSQARGSSSRVDMLSRVSWPVYSTHLVLSRMDDAFKETKILRACIQALNYSNVFNHLLALVEAIHSRTLIPLSVSCQPLTKDRLVKLAQAGTERIGIPLDAATKSIFERIKGPQVGGPYGWEEQLELLREAVSVFGKTKVSTHLIVGLGETERQMVNMIQECLDFGVLPGLFAFTPIRGTALAGRPRPEVARYRRIQIARYLILHDITRFENMGFDSKGRLIHYGVERKVVKNAVSTGEPFLTSGCPNCNRPYYNEKPSGPIYNYPRRLTPDEILLIDEQLDLS